MAAPGIANLFEQGEQQKYDVVVQLLNTMSVHYLQKLYGILKQLLSVDIISLLPLEISRLIFSYLNAPALSKASECCRRWKEVADSDSLWQQLCYRKNYARLSQLPKSSIKPSSQEAVSTESPTPLIHWKTVYMRAFALERNWILGKYNLSPLLRGHMKPVTCISCDDKALVSGSADNSVRIWDVQSCQCRLTLEGHTDSVNEVILNNGVVLTACTDGLVRAYDAKNGQYLKSFSGHTGSVDHLACNGRTIVSGGSDNLIRVWDLDAGKIQFTFSGHTDEIECVWLREDGKVALSGSWDCTMRLWDLQTGICKQLLISHTEVVYCCECVEWRVVSGGGDGEVKLWDMESGLVTNTLSGHKQEVLCIQCTTDVIASASADSTVRLWNYLGSCLHILDGHIGVVRCLKLKGDILVSGGDRKRIMVWDVKTGKLLHTVYRQQTLLHRMCVTDTQIITASPDSPGTICIVNYW